MICYFSTKKNKNYMICCGTLGSVKICYYFLSKALNIHLPYIASSCWQLLTITFSLYDSYILEGKELKFYVKNLQSKKGKCAAA